MFKAGSKMVSSNGQARLCSCCAARTLAATPLNLLQSPTPTTSNHELTTTYCNHCVPCHGNGEPTPGSTGPQFLASHGAAGWLQGNQRELLESLVRL